MSTSRPVLREGEWACVDARCSYINTIHHSSCQACGRRKPRGKGTVGQAIGKDAAEKSKGLFEAEDWCCSKCGNINWARRATCNICNAKKFAEVEARTGYGGGYMDRQQVEYIPRNESEEEYDEFGRLKGKRKRTNEKHDSGYENLDEKKGKMENYDKERPDEEYKGHDMEREEEEEEDDDDDEDGDLSKYQLGKYDFEKPLSKRRSRHRSPKRKRRRSSGSDDRSASPSRSRSGSYSSSTRDGSSGSDKSYSRSSGSYRGSSVSSRRSSSSSSRSRGRRSARHHSRSGKYRGHLYRRREKYRSKSSVTSTSGTESSRSDRSSESSSYSSSPSRDSYRHSRHRRQRRR